jgi:hypothetical protein
MLIFSVQHQHRFSTNEQLSVFLKRSALIAAVPDGRFRALIAQIKIVNECTRTGVGIMFSPIKYTAITTSPSPCWENYFPYVRLS